MTAYGQQQPSAADAEFARKRSSGRLNARRPLPFALKTWSRLIRVAVLDQVCDYLFMRIVFR